MYWFVHLCVIFELNPWDAYNPGRLDQHLSPFYEQGVEAGKLTREKAEELLQCFWVKYIIIQLLQMVERLKCSFQKVFHQKKVRI